ncbi:MAG TPA: porin [Beijerinckiaceae bacterium]|nr:porin [Beijerinckiaceae bacterium]
MDSGVGTFRFLRRIVLLAIAMGSAVASSAAAADEPLGACPELGRGYLRLPGMAACVALAGDLKVDYRQRFSRQEIFAEPQRDTTGPHIAYELGRLPEDRSLGRSRTELKTFFNTITPTEFGMLSTSIGFKSQVETPPRNPNDLVNEFNRTGKRTILERASIQLGGFSAGYMPSFFDFTPSLSYTTAYASEINTTVLAYTHRIPGIIDLTLSAEDGSERRLADPVWGSYRDARAPDTVIAARKPLDWGNIKVAAAAHPVSAMAVAECCGVAEGRDLGWAAMVGIEGWFDVGSMSSEILLNVALARGGLSYLGATNQPADFAVSAHGRVFLTDGRAAVAAYAHWWTKQIRTVFTFSAYETSLDTDSMRWRTSGSITQAALELVPRRGFVMGVEVNYHQDRAQGGDQAVLRPSVSNEFLSSVVFMRTRF